MNISVVGGTYDEHCFEPYWNERFGSGLRAARAINALSDSTSLKFYTFCDKTTVDYFRLLPFLQLYPQLIEKNIQFNYDHPLINPSISPRLDTIDRKSNNLNVEEDNILYYGFIEGSALVKGKKVVYDPQSPVMPISFWATGSKAEHLIYVVNFNEAQLLSKQNDIPGIVKYFIETEKAEAIVIKMGAKGAYVCTNAGIEKHIPVYKTEYVWPIGSGDIFAAIFALRWFETGDTFEAASEASWQTACYCNSRDFQFSQIGSVETISPLVITAYPTKQIYLAGPFFTFAERWLIDQIRSAMLSINLKVFSPLHDVGHGIATDVVPKDLQALDNSAIVFAVLDGLDSGTLFEIGYAIKMGIPVIGYVENESSESVKMLVGTDCILTQDMTTAIYKCFWKLSENA